MFVQLCICVNLSASLENKACSARVASSCLCIAEIMLMCYISICRCNKISGDIARINSASISVCLLSLIMHVFLI